mmetsp:Transcript_31822/g.42045  ORF Transcript_31822/g.42045 Transcript_31822/m.42045 type:complete len:297 (+) Transcript_31822:1-891(+)
MPQITSEGLQLQVPQSSSDEKPTSPTLSRQSTMKGRWDYKDKLPSIHPTYRSEEDGSFPQVLSKKKTGIFALDSPEVNSTTKIGSPPLDSRGLCWGMDMRLLFDSNGDEVQIEEARASYRHLRTVKSMTIMCRSPYNKINTMRCSVAMTIADVKEEMSRAWGAKELVVMWNGKRLYDHESLEDLGVEHNASFQFLDPLSLGSDSSLAEYNFGVRTPLLNTGWQSTRRSFFSSPPGEGLPDHFIQDTQRPRSRQSQADYRREGFERLDTIKIIGARWKKPKSVAPRSVDYRLYKYYN